MQKSLVAVALVACLAGCASRDPKIIARRDPGYFPSMTNRIAVSEHRQPRPENGLLHAALTAELSRRGCNLTSANAAEYVLAFWIEDNWNTMRPGGGFVYGSGISPVGTTTFEGSPVTAPGSLTVGVSPDGQLERYLVSQGIRLELYPRDKLRAGNLSAAWVGTIEGGITVKPDEQAALLRKLLDHFGQDFIGRVKLTD